MTRTRIKICGITRLEDGLAAAHLGADAIGLVFYTGSRRVVDITTARQVVRTLPPFVTAVGLFVNADPEMVRQVLRQVPLSLLQFHGNEDPVYCASFGLPFIKAVPMGASADVEAFGHRFKAAAGLLLDSHGGPKTGGSGLCFDWGLIPPNIGKPLILAGGLNPDNVTQAIKQIRPFGVDVSSGVESAKGIKDAGLMAAFIQGVERGQSSA
jgi:phosphoribosylanthranilate isomerase